MSSLTKRRVKKMEHVFKECKQTKAKAIRRFTQKGQYQTESIRGIFTYTAQSAGNRVRLSRD